VDVARLSALELRDANGETRRVGSYWEEQPVVLVFLRHFGCLHCREHAAELGRQYDDIRAAGAEVVAIGTGDVRYASAFVRDDAIPYPVLVDDDAEAARAASVNVASWYRLLHPSTWKATRDASKRGYKVSKPGKRVKQLGATFVIEPGDVVRYEHLDGDSVDHAAIDDVLAAVHVSS
jgi:peroxiredoxin